MKNNVIVLIPAFQPEKELIEMSRKLKLKGISLIVVNDGSSPKKEAIFQSVQEQGMPVIQHNKNKGKGEALKTGFQYVAENFRSVKSIITADADGQHSIKDIENIANLASENPQNLFLGSRKFKKEIPLRSQFGNLATIFSFFLLTGKLIKDTQTGLRAIPIEFAKELIRSKSKRYEFEMEMLHKAVSKKIPIRQIPIETIYEEGNRSSHFSPLKDSLKIYSVLLRYSVVSILSAAFDYLLFILFYGITKEILISSVAARFIAVFFNFLAAKKVVFHSKKELPRAILKYILLVIVNPIVSGSIIILLQNLFTIDPGLGKIIAESAMFLINFYIQKKFIF